jgi:hypothetical protein
MSRFAFIVGLLIASGAAFAQPTTQYEYSSAQSPEAPWQYEAQLSGGYSYLIFNHANNAFYNRSGPYIDANINLNLPDLHTPLVFGGGISASGYFDSNNFLGIDDLYSNVNLISFEGRVSLPISFSRDDQGLFFLPRVGVGFLFDNYVVQTPFGGDNYHNGGAFEVRPSIEIGYRWGRAALGLEGSYMAAWGSFGAFGSMAQELRAGLVFSYRF